MIVFLLSGKAESGKDTFYQLAKDYVQEKYLVFCPVRVAFADEVKRVARDMGWNGEKDESGRSGLIMIGDGARKYFDPTIWIKKTISQLEAIDATYKHQKGLSWVAEPMVFITDCRYPNEIEMPKKWALQNGHSIYAVRIVRDNHESKLTPEQLANISEIALDDFVGWDYVILNNGSFQEFNESVETVINDVVIHY